MYKVEFVKLHRRFEFLIPAKMKGKSGITILYQILLKLPVMLSFTLFMNASIPAGSVTFICFFTGKQYGKKGGKKKLQFPCRLYLHIAIEFSVCENFLCLHTLILPHNLHGKNRRFAYNLLFFMTQSIILGHIWTKI